MDGSLDLASFNIFRRPVVSAREFIFIINNLNNVSG